MKNLTNSLAKCGKFVLWFGLMLAVFLAVTAIVLPLSVILSDYQGNAPFSIGFAVTASIIGLFSLAVFGYSLRRIEANPIENNSPKIIDSDTDEAEILVRRKIEPRISQPQFDPAFITRRSIHNSNVINFDKVEKSKRRRI